MTKDWKEIKGIERRQGIKDGFFLGISASVCKKHRKIWKEGATFEDGACKECIEKADLIKELKSTK